MDHPRACGENQSLLLVHEHRVGSPPRMRGKPDYALGDIVAVWITPAHAGKTKPPNHNLTAYRDHPRACGENESI